MGFEHHTTDTESAPFKYWAQDFDALPDHLKEWRRTPQGLTPFVIYATSNRGATARWIEVEVVCDADDRAKQEAEEAHRRRLI